MRGSEIGRAEVVDHPTKRTTRSLRAIDPGRCRGASLRRTTGRKWRDQSKTPPLITLLFARPVAVTTPPPSAPDEAAPRPA
jgi:hypothetical protein